AADGRHQRHLLGHHRRRADCRRPSRSNLQPDHGLRRGGVGFGQHLRRVPGDLSHALHVQEEGPLRRIGGDDIMNETLTAFLYLIASICFIMSLRGLSSPESSRGGLLFGVGGMVIAIVTTVALPIVQNYWFIIAGIIAGGLVGTLIAQRIQMTALPQLVAAFHSLVGLAAVAVAAAAFYAPHKFGIGEVGNIHPGSLVEMGLGVAVGAVTFTGSIIAFAKLQALMSGAPLVFPGQHVLNALLGIGIVILIVAVIVTQSPFAFWGLVGVSLLLGFLLILPIGGADMPVVVSMLNSYSGWAACGIGFTLSNTLLIVTGALVGSSGAILSYIMCKGMNRSIF